MLQAGETAVDHVGDLAFEARGVVRLAMIGTGGRGRELLRLFLATGQVEVTALSDRRVEAATAACELARQHGTPEPRLYGDGDSDIEQLLNRDDVELVVVATPWDHHAPLATAAMEHGKHVAVEVPAALTIDECWQLVRTSEQTRRHCVMLENCCYGRNETLALNLVRQGVLGTLLHGEAAYIHDLRWEMFRGAERWRRRYHTERDGNLYPTHGLGPIANYMAINRGDRFDRLVSMSSPQHGMEDWKREHEPEISGSEETYRCGDVNSSLIKTARGLTILVQHQVSNPRPAERINLIQGTGGVFRDFPPRIYLEGQDRPGEEEYADIEPYRERFEHRLWREQRSRAERLGGHGGMDAVMVSRLVSCLIEGLVPDMDVYDAASLSVVGPLSAASVEADSAPVAFPDFTRGHWTTPRRNLV